MALPYGANLDQPGGYGAKALIVEAINDDAVDLYPGRLVYRGGASGTALKVKLPAAADFTALVRTFTPSSFTAGDIQTTINYNGKAYAIITPFDTNLGTTLTAHAADINEVFDDEYGAGLSIVAANSSDTALTLTAEIEGDWFTASCVPGDGTMVESANSGSNLVEMLVGVVSQDNTDTDSSGNARIATDAVASVVIDGEVNIEIDTAGATNMTDQLYVDTSSGNEGQLTTTRDADSVWVPRSLIRALETPASSTLKPVGAVVSCRLNFNGA